MRFAVIGDLHSNIAAHANATYVMVEVPGSKVDLQIREVGYDVEKTAGAIKADAMLPDELRCCCETDKCCQGPPLVGPVFFYTSKREEADWGGSQ
jgi:hypothetical protein